jgi:hypothetical protein
VAKGKNVDNVASLAKRRKLLQEFSHKFTQASDELSCGGPANALAVAQSTSLDGDIAASLVLGSMLDAESVNPSIAPIHDGAAGEMVSKALVKEALQSVRESLKTSTYAHGMLDSDEVTMFGEFAAHFAQWLRQNYHTVGPLLSRAALVLDSVRAHYTDLGDIRMRLCNRLPPVPSLLPSSLPFWLLLPSLSSSFRSLADRFRRQHPV